MAHGTCSFCGRTDRLRHSLCMTSCYRRWLRYGDPSEIKRIRGNDQLRLEMKTRAGGPGECRLMYDGPIGRQGYGQLLRLNGKHVYPHVFAYVLVKGPVPEGMEVDHFCHNPGSCKLGISCPHRRCITPEDLVAVEHRTHLSRGLSNQILSNEAGNLLYTRWQAGERICDLARAAEVSHALLTRRFQRITRSGLI